MKGMAASQVLIMVMSLVVIGLVVLLGFNAISSLNHRTEEADLARFESQLVEDVAALAPQFESVKVYGGKRQLPAPNGVTMVCMAQHDEFLQNPVLFDGLPPIVYESVKNQIAKNVFLLGRSGIVQSFYLDPVKIRNGTNSVLPWWCKKVINNVLPMRLEGRGDAVLLTPS